MPMPMAAPSKTARKRASLACSACSASLRAGSAERAMASCSARVRSRSAWAKPAAMRVLEPGAAGPARPRRALGSVAAAVEHQIGVDDAERAAERLGVGAVRVDEGGADRWAAAASKGRARRASLSLRASGSRCSSNSGRVSEVAVTGKIARLQIVANRRSLSSGPSGSAVEPVACGGASRLAPHAGEAREGVRVLLARRAVVGPPVRHRTPVRAPPSRTPRRTARSRSRERMISGLRMFR